MVAALIILALLMVLFAMAIFGLFKLSDFGILFDIDVPDEKLSSYRLDIVILLLFAIFLLLLAFVWKQNPLWWDIIP